jgi:molecular chaperone DnaK
MPRTTIDYGIDLGTTNSTIAVLNGTVPEVIPNRHGSSITPSAIWFDKRGKQFVGSEARARHIDDEDNAAVEFKLRMGQQWQKAFQRVGRKMLP